MKKKIVVRSFVWLSSLTLFFMSYSCNTDINEGGGDILPSEVTSLRDEGGETKYRLEQAARILLEISKDAASRSVIINTIRSGYYEDESIVYRDLFDYLNRPALVQLSSADKPRFSNAFNEILNNGNYPGSNFYGVTPLKPKGDNFDLESYLSNNKIQIYWPYSENWINETDVTPVISFHPIDNDSINIGWRYQQSGGKYSIQQVTVNDQFAENNPVWIVNFYEGSKWSYNNFYENNNSQPLTPICTEFPTDRLEVSIGKVKFFQNYDGIFDGGPEFIFVRGAVSVNSDGQISGTLSPFAEAKLRRKKYRWYNSTQPIWDTNWKSVIENQLVALYEEDPGTSQTVTVSGTVTYKPDDNTQTSQTISVSNNFKSRDAIIYNIQYDRCWYLVTSDDDTPFENYEGWNVRGVSGGVKWTMPYRVW